MTKPIARDQVKGFLDQIAGAKVPGLQYVAVTADHVLFDYAGGWADIRGQKAMTRATTLMAYSMTKTFTAVGVLQLVENGQLGIDDAVARYLPDQPYGQAITVRQLIDHTSGIPNPIPLRWVHLVEEDGEYDEAAALRAVLRQYPKLAFAPGEKYAYSNIGYWLLGQIIAAVTGQRDVDYLRANVLNRLALDPAALDFVIHDPARHANGYLAKYSLINLLKGVFTDRKLWGGYEGSWLRLKSHYLNGPAFGGLVGSAHAFGRFLQDQLRADSVLLRRETKELLESQQRTNAGQPIPMSLGWHIGASNGVRYFFKEGGGGGFHCEMRLYPAQGLGAVVMGNSTASFTTDLLHQLDPAFF